jgi:hypothetical protein
MSSRDARPAPLTRIRRVSRFMAGLSLGVAGLIVLLDVLLWLDPAAIEASARDLLPDPTLLVEITPLAWNVAFVLTQLLMGLLVYALWQAFRLFRAFARGEVFTPEAGDRLRRIGAAFVVVPFAEVLGTGLITTLLTLNNPEGQQAVAFTLEPVHVILGLAGGLVLVIGWVMAEAARQAADLEQIV